MDNKYGIRPLNAFSCGLRFPSYPLAEAAHLNVLGRGPCGGVLGMFEELAILHELSRLFIDYWQIPPVVCALVQ